MRPFTFKREAKWLFLIAVVPPGLGIGIAIAWPMIARWLAGH